MKLKHFIEKLDSSDHKMDYYAMFVRSHNLDAKAKEDGDPPFWYDGNMI